MIYLNPTVDEPRMRAGTMSAQVLDGETTKVMAWEGGLKEEAEEGMEAYADVPLTSA